MRIFTNRWRIPYPWVLVVTLGITETISWGILYYSFAIFMPVMESEFGWGRGAMSAAFGVSTIIAGLCAIPVGWWIDRFGARLPMTIGACLASVLVAAWSQVQTLEQFFLLWALIGIAQAMVLYEPAFAVINSWFDHRRARALTTVTLMAGFASTIFMPVESILIEQLGWQNALLTLAAFLAVSTILPHVLLVRAPLRSTTREAAMAAPSLGASFRTISENSTLRRLTIALAVTSLVSVGLSVHLPAYLQDLGFHAHLAAGVTGLVGAMQVVGRVLLQFLGDRLFLRGGVATLLSVQPVAILLLIIAPSSLGLLLSIALFGGARGIFTLVRPILVGRVLGSHGYATVSSMMALLAVVANALGPIVAGWGRDVTGDYQLILWLFIAASIVSAVIALPVGEQRTK